MELQPEGLGTQGMPCWVCLGEKKPPLIENLFVSYVAHVYIDLCFLGAPVVGADGRPASPAYLTNIPLVPSTFDSTRPFEFIAGAVSVFDGLLSGVRSMR